MDYVSVKANLIGNVTLETIKFERMIEHNNRSIYLILKLSASRLECNNRFKMFRVDVKPIFQKRNVFVLVFLGSPIIGMGSKIGKYVN